MNTILYREFVKISTNASITPVKEVHVRTLMETLNAHVGLTSSWILAENVVLISLQGHVTEFKAYENSGNVDQKMRYQLKCPVNLVVVTSRPLTAHQHSALMAIVMLVQRYKLYRIMKEKSILLLYYIFIIIIYAFVNTKYQFGWTFGKSCFEIQ